MQTNKIQDLCWRRCHLLSCGACKIRSGQQQHAALAGCNDRVPGRNRERLQGCLPFCLFCQILVHPQPFAFCGCQRTTVGLRHSIIIVHCPFSWSTYASYAGLQCPFFIKLQHNQLAQLHAQYGQRALAQLRRVQECQRHKPAALLAAHLVSCLMQLQQQAAQLRCGF